LGKIANKSARFSRKAEVETATEKTAKKRDAMNRSEEVWLRLAKAARKAPASGAVEAPFGFAQRVAARWKVESVEPAIAVWTWLGRQTIMSAAVVLAIMAALNYWLIAGAWSALSEATPLVELIPIL
jgi:hypothetical protein